VKSVLCQVARISKNEAHLGGSVQGGIYRYQLILINYLVLLCEETAVQRWQISQPIRALDLQSLQDS